MSFSKQNGAVTLAELLSVNTIVGDVPPLEQQELGTRKRLLVSAVVLLVVQVGEAVVPFVTLVWTTIVAPLLNVAWVPSELPKMLNSVKFQPCSRFRTLSKPIA
jgi:hypothetical protein